MDAIPRVDMRQVEKEIQAAEHEEELHRRSWAKNRNVI